ncbi:SLAP domain-containing protein [Holzapfeliella sp. JNUCC 80]
MKKTTIISGLAVATAAIGLSFAQTGSDTQAREIFDKTATANYVKGFGVSTWQLDSNHHFQPTGHYLPTDSALKIIDLEAEMVGNAEKLWYKVGNNEYVDSDYFDLGNETAKQEMDGIVQVKADAVESDNFKRGTTWKVFGRQISGNQSYYNVGNNTWIGSSAVELISENSRKRKKEQALEPLPESRTDDGVEYRYLLKRVNETPDFVQQSRQSVIEQNKGYESLIARVLDDSQIDFAKIALRSAKSMQRAQAPKNEIKETLVNMKFTDSEINYALSHLD